MTDREKILCALAELPATCDGVADYLATQGICGCPEDGDECPVHEYLRRAGVDACVQKDLVIFGDHQEEGVDLPRHVSEFIESFDAGFYPELIADDY